MTDGQDSVVDGDLAVGLQELGAWLGEHRRLWTERPFVQLPLSWEADEPEVAAALRALPLETVEAYEPDPARLEPAPPAFRRWAEGSRLWSRRPRLEPAPSPGSPPLRVPARKWAQVRPFADLAAGRRPAAVDRWLDWCCGKGHLGRSLSLATGLPFTGVEKDEALCRAGANLAVGQGVLGRFVVADVLEDDLDDEVDAATGLVALHACGRLHERFLRLADSAGAPFVVLAPCCYHRHHSPTPRPLSRAAAETGLALEVGHYRLVGLREVVASPRRAMLRRREQAFRLGLDGLVRQATGVDRYVAVGALPRAWADLPFEVFCRRAAERAEVDLPAEVDWFRVEAEAWERIRTVRALALVRGLFREPLETWLVMDRARSLVEQGWSVEIGAFCDDVTSPRNAVIVGRR